GFDGLGRLVHGRGDELEAAVSLDHRHHGVGQDPVIVADQDPDPVPFRRNGFLRSHGRTLSGSLEAVFERRILVRSRGGCRPATATRTCTDASGAWTRALSKRLSTTWRIRPASPTIPTASASSSIVRSGSIARALSTAWVTTAVRSTASRSSGRP